MAYKPTTRVVTKADGSTTKVRIGSNADKKYGGGSSAASTVKPFSGETEGAYNARVAAAKASPTMPAASDGTTYARTSPATVGGTAPPPVSLETKVSDTPATTEDAASDYYPRYYEPETTTVAEPQDVETIQRGMQKDAQGEINSLRDYEKQLLDEQAVINQKDARTTQGTNTINGLAGSSEADFSASATAAKGQKENDRIRTAVETQVQGILSAIRKDAVTEARAQREDARLDEASRIQNKAARMELANESLKNLAASGATFDGLRKTDPKAFEYLARQYGSTEALKGAFTLNTPQDQILDKQIKGGSYVIAKQNPITGKVTVETVDLGLPPSYTDTIDAGNRILAVPDNWDGDPSKLVSIPKGLTPTQAAAGGASGAGGAYANDLDAIIGATLSTIPSKFGQATFQSQIAKARNDQDKINLIAAQVLKGQPAELRTDFANQAVGISELDKALAELDKGAQTGLIQNGAQYAFNLAGKDYDPKLAKIAAHITAAIQPYRNSVTGAAWGTQEDGEYQQLFGSTKYEPAALRQRLTTLKDILKNKSASGLNTFVNPMGYYENQFEGGALTQGGDVRSRAEEAGYDYDAMKRDGLSDEEIAGSL
jgi:hypothetical protein